MACFNAERTVLAAVESVLAQSMGELELIVVDDASTDRSVDLLRTLDDPRLVVIPSPANAGPGAARDRAIAAGSAPWIALTDADDEWHPDRLRVLLEVAEGHAPCLVFDNLMMCHDTARGMLDWRPLRPPDAFGSAGDAPVRVSPRDYIVSERLLMKPVFPRSALAAAGIRHSARKFGEDAQYFIRLLATGLPMYYLPAPMYRYRISPGSLTAASRRPAEMRECLEDLLEHGQLPVATRDAVAEKIILLRQNEDLYAIVAALRHLDAAGALRILRRDPALLHALRRRAGARLRYEWHRIRHGGASRSD